MLLMATAMADHVCVKWTCKAGWREWVDFAPPHLQNASTCENRRHFCTHPGAYPGKVLLWDAQHSGLHAGHCCCWQLVNSPRPSFSIKEGKKGSSPFLTLFFSELPCYLRHSWLHPRKLNSRSEEIWSSSPTSYSEWLFIKVRYSFTFTGHSFCSLSALLNAGQVTYGLCQLHCKSFVPFNENIARVFLLSLLEPSHILVINGAYWWRNAPARPTTLQGHCADPKLWPGVVSTSLGVSAPPCRWGSRNLCRFFFHWASGRLNCCIKSHCCHSY